jgi:hypothetical protein
VPLADTFIAYLRGRAGRDDMADALAASGHALEASLLSGERTAWVGPMLPSAAVPGDVWLDTVELMPMVHFARVDGEPVGWIAMRPVERWQFAAFRELGWTWSFKRLGGLKPMDADRLLAGDENGAVTRILRDEAALYAMWFGKSIPARVQWQLAAEVMDTDPLWGPVREWADMPDDGAAFVADAELIDFDPDDDYPPEVLIDGAEAPADVGFRTYVRSDSGLYTETWPSATYGLRIGRPARRDR